MLVPTQKEVRRRVWGSGRVLVFRDESGRLRALPFGTPERAQGYAEAQRRKGRKVYGVR